MPRVKFNTVVSEGSTSAWGYPVEATKEGVFGVVPDELIESEVAAGRVILLEQPKTAEPVADAQTAVENSSGKRLGRPPKAD